MTPSRHCCSTDSDVFARRADVTTDGEIRAKRIEAAEPKAGHRAPPMRAPHTPATLDCYEVHSRACESLRARSASCRARRSGPHERSAAHQAVTSRRAAPPPETHRAASIAARAAAAARRGAASACEAYTGSLSLSRARVCALRRAACRLGRPPALVWVCLRWSRPDAHQEALEGPSAAPHNRLDASHPRRENTVSCGRHHGGPCGPPPVLQAGVRLRRRACGFGALVVRSAGGRAAAGGRAGDCA